MSLKSVLVILPLLAVAGAGAIGLNGRGPTARASQDLAPDESKLPGVDEARIKKLVDALRGPAKTKSLLKERCEAAFTECDARWQDFLAGRGTLDIFLGSSQRLCTAERDLSLKKADQVAALEGHWKRMQKVEEINQARFNAARIAVQELAQSRYFRLDAEIQLARARTNPDVTN
jgi:hypothetical protein